MNFQKNKNKYLLLGIYTFVLFFISASAVFADSQPVKLKADPNTVVPGGTTTITWSAPGADYCVSSWSGSNWSTSGTFKTPKLTSNTRFTVTCYNPNLKFCIGKTNASKELCQIKTADKCISPLTPDCYLKTYIGAAELTVNVAIPDGTITDVSTQEVKNKTSNSAVLLGSMNPNGWGENDASANAYFRYSTVSPENITPIFCNDVFGSNMKSTKEITVYGHTIQQANIEVTNLSPDTTYYYCMVGSTPKQIAYGGVRSFTTFMPEGKVSIKTENARVLDETSVYLNGTYNTTNLAETWFEYRQTGAILEGGGGNGISFFKKLENKIFDFFGVKDVFAVSPITFEWSKKINIIKHKGGSNGKLYYLLENLSPGTGYEARAAIKVLENPKIPSSGQTIYGETKSFTTVGTSGSNAGDPNNGGGGYEDPCTDPLDVNCNGTGDPGNGGGGDPGNGGGTLNDTPDLTASATSPSQIIVNKSTKIYSNIKNIGGGSTLKDFYNFFQISTIGPSNYEDIPDETNPPMSFLKNIFKVNKASAISSPLINLSSNLMTALSGHGFKTISQDYTFNSVGTYYIRVCADKKSPTDAGLIKESYESNNCGPWTKTIVSLDGNGTGNDPGGGWTGGGTGTGGGGTGGGGTSGGTGTWIWTSGGNGAGNGSWTWTGNSNYTGGAGTGTGSGSGNNTNTGNGGTLDLTIGQKIDPPNDAIVRYHEGIETVFARQIISNQELAKSYGYSEENNLDTFAWSLADTLARTFGYVDSKGKEIRVSQPDIAAYQLYMNNGILTVYEYYDSTIVNIQKMSGFLRIKYYYEYYFKK
jgi:hypothetical protein